MRGRTRPSERINVITIVRSCWEPYYSYTERGSYENEIGVIKSGASEEEEAKITRGVRRGRWLSPCLFNLYVQEAIDEIREKGGGGLNVHGE